MSKSDKYLSVAVNGTLNKTPFKLRRKSIYFLNFTGVPITSDHILSNMITAKGYTLSILEPVMKSQYLNIVEYFLPFLTNTIPLLRAYKGNSGFSEEISKYFEAPVQYLIYSHFHNVYVNSIKTPQDLINFINQIPAFEEEPSFIGDDLFSPNTFSRDTSMPLDKETQKIIDDLNIQLQNLNDTGHFLTLLPLIEQELEKYKSRLDFPVSDLHIDEQYRIFLKDYNNKEVKLSHLSKSIYFLFLMKGEIHLNDFQNYKWELLTIYKHISNQENLDKMKSTIENLVFNENKELYVHFSRIKSAFCSVIADGFAMNYYIRGDKNKPKKIFLDPSKSNVKELESEFFLT